MNDQTRRSAGREDALRNFLPTHYAVTNQLTHRACKAGAVALRPSLARSAAIARRQQGRVFRQRPGIGPGIKLVEKIWQAAIE